MNKTISALFVFYLLQFLCSACDPCHCSSSSAYERTYTEFSVQAWNTAGFQIQQVSDSVNIESFGLSLSINFELEEISMTNFQLGSFGYTSAFACDCVGPEYINVDPIETIEIIVTDIKTNIEFIVTDNFSTYGYDGEQLTIAMIFENRAEWHDGFQLDLTSSKNIPTDSNFTINIYLESGIKLTSKTQPIRFYGL